MGLGLLLVPALAGYLVQTQLHFFRYRTLRESGHHVFFRSGLTGSILGFFAQVIVHFVDKCMPHIGASFNEIFAFEYSTAAILSLILAFAIWPLGNLLTDKKKAAIRSARENGELMGILITEAIGSGKSVEVSLDTGKVYVGPIVQSGIGKRSQFDLMIVPLFSGYRHRDTNELIISHSYSRAITRKARDWKELKIGMSISHVVLVRFFDPSLYREFSNDKEPIA